MRLGVNVAATVLVTLLVAIGGYAASGLRAHPAAVALTTPSPTPSKPAEAPSAPPQQAPSPSAASPRLSAEDLTMLDSSIGWSLLTNCSAPADAACHYSVAGTLDGGKSWTEPVLVGPTFDSTDGSAPRHIRFVNRLDGFVYGFDGAFVTHDGGKSWNSVGLPAVFTYDIAVGGKTVWAVTSPCGKGALCQLEVRASLDGGRSWWAPHALPLGFSPESLVAFESGVVMSSVPAGEMQLTSDGGASWRAIKTQCSGNPFRGYVATFDGKELWELCMGYPDTASNSADKALFVSEDGGKSWAARATSQPGGGLQHPGWPVWLVSNRPAVAFISGTPTPFVTSDAGATWTPLSIQLSEIHFAGPSSGWALDGAGNIWVTTDGGDHWGQSGALPTFMT
jgi:hypothetical protein